MNRCSRRAMSDGNWLVDIVYGGLNYQIEHHLFPTLARNQLRRAARLSAPTVRRTPYRIVRRASPPRGGQSSRTMAM